MSHGPVGGTDRRGVVAIIPRANRGIAGDAAGRSRTNRDSQGALARAPIPRDVIRERKGARGTGGYTDRRVGGGPIDGPTAAYRRSKERRAGNGSTRRGV